MRMPAGAVSVHVYILVMVFYLQKVSSPVLPVLQEMHSLGTANAENLVDGMPGWSVSSEWIK